MNAVPNQVASKSEVVAIASASCELFAGYPDLLTPAHIAEITGMTAHYVRTLCRRGKLPAVQIGEARWYVPKPRFIAFVNGETVG